MFMSRFLMSLITMLLLLTGCSSNESAPANTQQEEQTLTPETLQKDADVIESEASLEETLTKNAQSMSKEAFRASAIETIVPTLVRSYVPSSYAEDILKHESLKREALEKNGDFIEKVDAIYDAANNTQRSALVDISSMISDISGMIYDFIYNFLFGEEDESTSSIFDDAIDWILGNDDEPVADTNITDPTGNGGTLESESLGFTLDMIKGKRFYVVSSKADMTVDVESSGTKGSGSMGFISMDFNVALAGADLDIDTSLMGKWKIKMTYLDSDHCIAADAVDEGGEVYQSFWFINASDKAAAKTVTQAQSICYQHGWVGGAPSENTIDESDVVDIADARDGFENKTGSTTKEIVNALHNSPSNVADVEDAKYFTRSLRHGMLSLYTTNEKPDTLEAIETEVVSRTLMPIAGSSLLQMKDLAGAASDTTIAFSDEVLEDLNASLTQLSGRMSALGNAVGSAMDATMSDNDYHGTATSSYGDQVDIWVTDMDVNICLIFFLCESSVDATVHFAINNNGQGGNYADVQFATRINAEQMDINAINFSKVVSEQAVNRFAANGYELDIDYFEFQRNSGNLRVKGSGSMNEITSSAAKTIATFDAFDTLIVLQQQSYDITDYAIKSANLSLDGKIDTKDGRKFDGSFYFDAKDTSANKISGTLVGINGEPTVEGTLTTSLSYNDIDVGLNGRAEIGVNSNLPYFVNSNGTKSLVASFYPQFDKYRAEDFERNTYDCTQSTQNSYSCTPWSGGASSKTLKLTAEGDIITIGTNQGDWYVVDIKNVNSFASSEMVLLHTESGEYTGLDQFEYNQADVNNVRVSNHSLNEELSINNIGDHSYTIDMRVTQSNQSLETYIAASRDTQNGTWSYFLNDLSMANEYGQLTIDEMFIKDQGSLRFEDEIYDILLGNVIGDYSFGVDSLLGLQWDNFKDIKELRISSLEMLMHTNGAGDAKVFIDTDLANASGSNITGDFNAIYQYDQTDFNVQSSFDVAVSGSGDNVVYTPTGTASGSVKTANTADYSYAIEAESDKKYILLTNDTTTYQQGFIVNTTSATGADSYGVKASFNTSLENRQIDKLVVSNKNGTTHGTYDRAVDTQKITYTDGVVEYLYIH